MSKPETIDGYIAALTDPGQKSALEKLRRQISNIVPAADEGFSYGMPAFRLKGKPVAGFTAAKTHCSFFPMSGSIVEMFVDELKDFQTSKGTIRFQPGNPIPLSVLRKLIKARLAELQT